MRLTPLKPRVLIQALKRLDFECIRQEGSHMFFRHTDGRTTVVPHHKGEDIGRGLVRSILNDIEMDWFTFRDYL